MQFRISNPPLGAFSWMPVLYDLNGVPYSPSVNAALTDEVTLYAASGTYDFRAIVYSSAPGTYDVLSSKDIFAVQFDTNGSYNFNWATGSFGAGGGGGGGSSSKALWVGLGVAGALALALIMRR